MLISLLLTLSAIETVTVCQISPALDGKVVSIRAEVFVGFEIQSLRDAGCPQSAVWFELADSKKFRGMKRFSNPKRKVTAVVIGTVRAGKCFGHDCYSDEMVFVEEFRDVKAKSVETTSCAEALATSYSRFKHGHMDNVQARPIRIASRASIQLLGPDDRPLVEFAQGIFQIAVTAHDVIELHADSNGRLKVPPLPSGLYAFTAVGRGFQSSSGCLVVSRLPSARRVFRLPLLLGV